MSRALFVGHTYIDVTVLADAWPSGDEKSVARDYAVAFGGNAVTAAFACAKLALPVDLITSLAPDWLGRMFQDMTQQYAIGLYPRAVERSSLSFIRPQNGKRAIVRARDDQYLAPYPHLAVEGYAALHLDGHQPDAALYYAKACRDAGILTSLDGGGLRENTQELLAYIDVAVCAERMAEQLNLTPEQLLYLLQDKGCRIGAVTQGEQGMLWYDEHGVIQRLPALPISKERIVDTSGAGDVFHGAYIASYIKNPSASWEEHFRFARAASSYKIQHLGNEAGLPSCDDIKQIMASYPN